MNNNCKICNNFIQAEAFEKLVLNKYKIKYYICSNCGFLQTEEPFWLEEAYSEAISSADVGLLSRNIENSDILRKTILLYFNSEKKFLDFGGGYGVLVRLMRDKGFNFFWQDKYCKNLFSQYFELERMDEKERCFELVSAFEVFEHHFDPVALLTELLVFSDSVIFSTELIPENTDIKTWWYLAPEAGQHISFFSRKSLEILAEMFDLSFFSNEYNLHLFSKKSSFPSTILKKNSFVDNIKLLTKKKRKKILIK